jgi:hypothetical protein
MAATELQRLNMHFDYAKCKALWVRNGIILMDKDDLNTPDGGKIAIASSLLALGIPITRQQDVRDRQFVKLACNALRAADIASLLFHQNALNIERLCVASRLTRFVQTVNVSEELLKQFDDLFLKKILRITHAEDDVEQELASLPINLGGLGFIRLSAIQRPALLATWYKLIQTPAVLKIFAASRR